MPSDSGSQGDSDEDEIADYVNNEMSEYEKAREERIKKLEEMKKKIGLAPIAAQPEQVNLYVIYIIKQPSPYYYEPYQYIIEYFLTETFR